MKCKNCGTLIDNQENICPVCMNAVEHNDTNTPNKTLTNELNNNQTEEIEFVDLSEENNLLKEQPKEENIIQNDKNQNVNQKENKTKKTINYKLIAVITVSLIIVLIITISTLITYYVLILDKPRQQFVSNLEVLKTKIHNNFYIDRNLYKKTYSIKTELNENDKVYGSVYKHINELTLDLDIFSNISENYLFFELVTTYQYQNHVNLIGLLDSNLLHINSPTDYKEYYTFDTYNNIFEEVKRVTDEEILNIIDEFLNSFNTVLKSEYFKTKESIVTIDNKQINLITNSFVVNETNMKEITEKVILKLCENENFLNAYSKYKNINAVDFIGELNTILESFQIGEYKIPEFEFSLYMDTKENLIGAGVKLNEEVYSAFIEENKIEIYKNFDEKIISIEKDEEKYTINFSGGKIYINYKKTEGPMFTKPNVETNSILYNSLTDEEKETLEELFYDGTVMYAFMYDFERFNQSIEMSINNFLNPSKEKFKNEIYEIMNLAREKHFLSNTLSGNSVYTNEIKIPGNRLNINKINSIYYVKLNSDGLIKRIVYMDNKYCFDSDKMGDLDYIDRNTINERYITIRTKKDSYESCMSNIKPFE